MGRRSEEKRAKVGVKATRAVTAEPPLADPSGAAEPSEAMHPQEPLLPPVVDRWLRDHAAELGICLFLVAATLAVFGRTIGHDFVSYDDNEYVYQNRHVRDGLTPAAVQWAFAHVHSSNWHPLTTLSHMLDCSLYGLWAPGHHLTNVLLHAAAAVALFMALRRLTGAVWRSGIVAALFCLHPLRVESVAWVAERKDVLSGLFFGLTLWAYAGYAQRPFSWARYLGVVVLFALGLLCKPMLVTLPFLLLLLDYWPLGRMDGGLWTVDGKEPNQPPTTIHHPPSTSFLRLIIEKLPLMALSAASCVVTYRVQAWAGTVTEAAPAMLRVQTAVLAYARYLAMMFWPAGLAVPYPRDRQPNVPAMILCGLVLLGISLAVLLWNRRGGRYALVGWLWYAGMLVPVSGLVTIGDEALADRYTYLPLIGIFLLLVWGAADLLGRQGAKWGPALAGVVLVLCAGGSIHQAGYWRDSETLFGHALAITPENATAHANLGVTLLEKGGNRAEAEDHFRQALRINPKYSFAHNNLGILESEKGNWPRAIESYMAALAVEPNLATTHCNLAAAYAAVGQMADAEQECREALRIDADSFIAERALGVALAGQGRYQEAVPHYRRAIALDPGKARDHLYLGRALAAEGSAAEAIEEYKTAVKISPEDVNGYNELAKTYHTLGRLREAAEQWAEVLRRNPRHAAAAKGLGMVLVKAGQGASAIGFLQAALAAAPRDLETRKYKAFAHLAGKQPREAVAEFREILSRDPKNQIALNGLAWIEATHADATLRKGKEALELAQQAVAIQKGERPQLLDTLAAAYAEAGRFQEAAATARQAKKAAEQGKDRALVDGIDARLKLYESGKPYREAP